MSSPAEKAVIKTLAYADVFDWPLKKEEIWKWLIEVKSQKSKVKNTIKNLKLLDKKGKFYFLKKRKNIVRLRKLRGKWSREKIKTARQIIPFLKLIPTVKLVGVTGALATNNAKKDDDIDLFIITSAGRLWTTRLSVTGVLDVLDKRRRPDDKEVNNKICLNMFMDEKHLGVPQEERDLFSAHEVVQMRPLYNRNDTYKKFLMANLWVRKYLPNAVEIKDTVKTPREWQAESPALPAGRHDSPEVEGLKDFFFNLLERFLRRFQLWYMRKRRTTEVISDGIIRFHPQDAREWVLKEYKRRLMLY